MPPEEHLSPPEREIERITYERAKAKLPEFVRRYRDRFGDHFSSDKAAELFPEYTRDRTNNRAAVTKASHLIADSAVIDRITESDKTAVTMVMGGPGAGKTTTANEAVALGRIVFDGSAVHGEHLIDRIAASGRQIENIYIHRDPVDAFRSTLLRAVQPGPEQGRVIPLQLHVDLHKGSAEAIQRIGDKHSGDPNVTVRYVVNSSVLPPRAGSIEDVEGTSYTGIREQLSAVLDDESSSGRIPREICDRVRKGPGARKVFE